MKQSFMFSGYPLKNKHQFLKDIALATVPGLLALIFQKLLEEGFEYIKSQKQADKPCCKCKCSENIEEPDDSHEQNDQQNNQQDKMSNKT